MGFFTNDNGKTAQIKANLASLREKFERVAVRNKELEEENARLNAASSELCTALRALLAERPGEQHVTARTEARSALTKTLGEVAGTAVNYRAFCGSSARGGEMIERLKRARDTAGTHYTTLRNETADEVIAALSSRWAAGEPS